MKQYQISLFKKLRLLFLLLLLITEVTHAQVAEKKLDSADNPLTAKPPEEVKKTLELKKPSEAKSTALKQIMVTKVYNANYKDTTDKRFNSAGIGDIIVVEVSNLDSLLRRSKCKDRLGNPVENSYCHSQTIRLFVNGRMVNNIEPISGAPDKDKGTLQYRLDRNNQNDKMWADILGAPPLGGAFFIKQVKVSVGLENEYALETVANENNFTIIRIHKNWFWWSFFGLIGYFFLLVWLIKSRGLLRDRGIDVSPAQITNTSTSAPFSLARCQMTFWFTMVIASFLFIWLITNAYDIITSSILALIGISAGTSLSALIIDNSKSEELLQQTVALQTEESTLTKDISDIGKSITTPLPGDDVNAMRVSRNTKEARLEQIKLEIAKNIKALTPQNSHGFFKDILTDVNGVSFNRLQMLVWTFVLGLVFLYNVWKSLSMPDFNITLLALQGITAGTDIGFKIPEKQA